MFCYIDGFFVEFSLYLVGAPVSSSVCMKEIIILVGSRRRRFRLKLSGSTWRGPRTLVSMVILHNENSCVYGF